MKITGDWCCCTEWSASLSACLHQCPSCSNRVRRYIISVECSRHCVIQ